MKTRITKILGIEYPLILGGMVYISRATLTAAVSEAGGLGTLAAGSMDKSELRREIEETRNLTGKPFGVNIPLVTDSPAELIQVCLDMDVPVIVLSAGKPNRYLPRIKDRGVVVIQVVSNVSQAVKMDAAGVDAIIAEGFEAGGHIGGDEITTMSLIPQCVDAVGIPVIAAGGIADARGFIAALSLGAEAVQIGTAFAATRESPAHDSFKSAVVRADDRATVVTGRKPGSLVRGIRNAFTEAVGGMEHQGISDREIMDYIGADRSYDALISGDIEEGSLMAGQIAGLVKEVKGVKDVFNGITDGIETVLGRLFSMKADPRQYL